MPTNIRQFNLETRRAARIPDEVALRARTETIRRTYLFAASTIQVRTGLLRGNLQITSRGPARRVLQRFGTGVPGITSPTDIAQVNAELAKFRTLAPYATLVISNPVPYWPYVEGGTPTLVGTQTIARSIQFASRIRLRESDLRIRGPQTFRGI